MKDACQCGVLCGAVLIIVGCQAQPRLVAERVGDQDVERAVAAAIAAFDDSDPIEPDSLPALDVSKDFAGDHTDPESGFVPAVTVDSSVDSPVVIPALPVVPAPLPVPVNTFGAGGPAWMTPDPFVSAFGGEVPPSSASFDSILLALDPFGLGLFGLGDVPDLLSFLTNGVVLGLVDPVGQVGAVGLAGVGGSSGLVGDFSFLELACIDSGQPESYCRRRYGTD